LLQEIVKDSGGAGQWDGAPATRTEIRARDDEVRFIWVSDGAIHPPRGFDGGLDGISTSAAVIPAGRSPGRDPGREVAGDLLLSPGDTLVSTCNSGGGFGKPLQRDPEAVLHRVREGWVSSSKAERVYGVLIADGKCGLCVDAEATRNLRIELGEREGC
jgi:N-methylhydantoinase B